VGVSTHLPPGGQVQTAPSDNHNARHTMGGGGNYQETTTRTSTTGREDGSTDDNNNDIIFWLHSSSTNTCLGPDGQMGACGETSLWRKKKKQDSSLLLNKSVFQGGDYGCAFYCDSIEDVDEPSPTSRTTTTTTFEEEEFALEVVDILPTDVTALASSATSVAVVQDQTTSLSSTDAGKKKRGGRRRRRNRRQTTSSTTTECLARQTRGGTISTRPCHKQRRLLWKLTPDGYLMQYDVMLSEKQQEEEDHVCLATSSSSSSSEVTLESCKESSRLIQFTIRPYYAAAATSSMSDTRRRRTTTTSRQPSEVTQQQQREAVQEQDHIPMTQDLAHAHARVDVTRTTSASSLAGERRMKTTTPLHLSTSSGSSSTVASTNNKRTPWLHQSNPILFATTSMYESERQRQQRQRSQQDDTATPATPPTPSPMSTGQLHPSYGQTVSSSSSPIAILSPGSSSSSTISIHDPSYKLKRMQTHPYLKSAKDGRWNDPLTSLEYPTDLCHYLGHTRKEAGRHTLVGVGQYTRTVFKVRVYGVALYVSKRDVLADPAFSKYASMTAEQLRQEPDFYALLRTMTEDGSGSSGSASPDAGTFDRTIYLQLNMQLSTDTMRSSLEADWKLLTDERKKLLIHSSLKPRPAEAGMLETIQDRQRNPGRCSCGQVAPPSYQADPTCCSRGTSLVFTWRKSGALEIRVDGRVMDTFQERGDVAHGIFYEYLRTDDPISPDFQDRVVDGFPFLLGPLSQVQGIVMPPPMASSSSATADSSSNHNNNSNGPMRTVGKALGNVAGRVSTQAGDAAGWIQGSASHAVSNTVQSAKSLFEREEERRQRLLWTATKRRDAMASSVGSWLRRTKAMRHGASTTSSQEGDEEEQRRATKTAQSSGPRGRVFRSPVHYWFGVGDEHEDEDASSSQQQSTDQEQYISSRLFVHFYLFLLLIVSLPTGPQYQRMAFRKKTSSEKRRHDDGDESDSDSHSTSESTKSGDENDGEGGEEVWCHGQEKDVHNDDDDNFVTEGNTTLLSKHLARIRSFRSGSPPAQQQQAQQQANNRQRVGAGVLEPKDDDEPATQQMKKALSYFL